MPKAIIKQWYGSFSAAWAMGSLPWYWALAIGAALAAPDAFAYDATPWHAGVRIAEVVPAPRDYSVSQPQVKGVAERRRAVAADQAGAPR